MVCVATSMVWQMETRQVCVSKSSSSPFSSCSTSMSAWEGPSSLGPFRNLIPRNQAPRILKNQAPNHGEDILDDD
eukprot:7105692-Prorocentrum_lima.AAC.1